MAITGSKETNINVLRKELPFRVGTTSYVYPEDILSNVHKLKGKVDDIELVLFEADNTGNIPTQKTIKELNKIGNDCSLTYTVHLPLDINLGDEEAEGRENSVKKIAMLVNRLSILNPYAYILHINLPERAKTNISLWQERVGGSLEGIKRLQSVIPKNIAVENLSYSFEYVDGLVLSSGFSTCVDIGHLIIMKIDPLKYLEKYFNATRVIHFHGVKETKDHISLKYLDVALIRNIIRFLKDKNYKGVLTLEVFSITDFNESMDALWESLYL